MGPTYTYLVADLRTNQIIAELPLTGVSFNKRINESGKLAATLNIGDPKVQVAEPYDVTSPVRRCIYVMRDALPVWGGIIWTRRYDSSTRQIQIGCGDFWSYFDHRRVLPVLAAAALTDATYTAPLKTAYTATDQNVIARNLVALAQSHTGGNIQINTSIDTSTSGINRQRTYWGYDCREVGTALRELAGVINGPDMVFDVVATSGGGAPTRIFRQGTPALGQVGSAWVWESGGNLLDYVWPSDGTRTTTRAFAAGNGIEKAMLIGVAEDSSVYTNGWPLLETENAYNTVTDGATLFSHAQADQQISRLPVVLPVLTVHGGMSPTTTEMNVGDDGRLVVLDEFHTGGLDTRVRLIDLAVAISDESEETVTLTMAPTLQDVV